MAAIAAVVEAADETIAMVDQAALAQHVAFSSPEYLERGSAEGAQAAGKKKKEMEEMKAGLIDALSKKCQALFAGASQVINSVCTTCRLS